MNDGEILLMVCFIEIYLTRIESGWLKGIQVSE